MNKLISLTQAAAKITDGMTIMIGGFMGCGNPHHLVDALVDAGVKDLTMIANDAAVPGYGIAKLVEQKRLRKIIASHVGLNPEVAKQMNSGELEVELVPQGTLAERIRAGGAGLGGVLTPTGIGTPVEEGKRVIEVQGRKYLLEEPLRADAALINGYRIDARGNVWYKGTTRTFNIVMATAADLVIAEADHLVETGSIAPEDVVTPFVFVDYIVEGGGGALMPVNLDKNELKTFIARRVAKEMHDGDFVNLGIGLPTLVPRYLPEGVEVILESENGIVGATPAPEGVTKPGYVVDAGGRPAGIMVGGAYIDSPMSFTLIRGGHVDATVLGALQVDRDANLANWIIPGKMVPGMGGAMDLVVGAKKVIVAMEHTQKGAPKILERCTLPLTAVNCVSMIVTEYGVFRFIDGVLTLTEINPEVTVDEVRAATEADFVVADELVAMV